MGKDSPAQKPPKSNTFVVRVDFQQHGTWQGSVDWVNQHRKKPFRSALELLKIMDSALTSEDANGPDAEDDAP